MGKKVLLCLFLVRFQSNVEDGLEVARRCGCRWRWSLRHSETGMDWSRARREGREEKRRPWREREKVDRVLPVGACACTAPISGQSDAGDWLAFVRHSGPDLREAVPVWGSSQARTSSTLFVAVYQSDDDFAESLVAAATQCINSGLKIVNHHPEHILATRANSTVAHKVAHQWLYTFSTTHIVSIYIPVGK